MSRKSERLVNLVIALLATKRNLTKSEIFRTIEGYEGSDESMERMFERDKDELRSLGIEIEVSGLDPLFEDEQGYRIRPENFRMDSKGYSAVEIAYMSLAAQLWKDASLDDLSQRVLRKLSGFAPVQDIAQMPAVAPLALSAPIFLNEIISAISDRRMLQFSYVDSELAKKQRNVYVYSYFSHKGYWYFSGLDIDKSEIRTFRCDRIASELVISKKLQSYEIPEDFQSNFVFEDYPKNFQAYLRIRKGRGSQLKHMAISTEYGDDFDVVKIEYPSEDKLVALILWHLDDVEVISPQMLRTKIIDSLAVLVKSHG